MEKGGQAAYIARIRYNQKQIDKQDIMDYMKKKVPEYMLPSSIEVLCKMPLTMNGKIDKKFLESRLEKRRNTRKALSAPPERDLEKRLANIWKEILNKDQINKDDNFFDIGGDSLLIAQAVAKIQKDMPEAQGTKWDWLMILL